MIVHQLLHLKDRIELFGCKMKRWKLTDQQALTLQRECGFSSGRHVNIVESIRSGNELILYGVQIVLREAGIAPIFRFFRPFECGSWGWRNYHRFLRITSEHDLSG